MDSTEAALCELLQLCAVGDAAHVEAMLARCEERGIGADLLVDGDDEDSSSSPPSKKRKAGGDADESDSPAAEVICEHCGGAVPLISLRVACLDGSSLDLKVPPRELVREVKRAIGQVRRPLL